MQLFHSVHTELIAMQEFPQILHSACKPLSIASCHVPDQHRRSLLGGSCSSHVRMGFVWFPLTFQRDIQVRLVWRRVVHKRGM